MKMKQQRAEQKKFENSPPYAHTCNCMRNNRIEYLHELPASADCVNPRFFKNVRKEKELSDSWIDVSEKVSSYF